MGRRRRNESNVPEIIIRLIAVFVMAGFALALIPGGKAIAAGFVSLFITILLIGLGVAIVVIMIVLFVRHQRRQDRKWDNHLLADIDTMPTYDAPYVPRPPQAKVVSEPPPPVTPKRSVDFSERLRAIDWFQFEKLVAKIFENRGWRVERRGGAKADGGIDLIVEKGAQRCAVQCKHWQKWKIKTRTVREFLGALTAEKIGEGFIVTLNECTPDAADFARQHKITIVPEGELKLLLAKADAAYDPEFIALLDDTRKYCPKCESEMVLRTAERGLNRGNQFWGCSQYPRCSYILREGSS